MTMQMYLVQPRSREDDAVRARLAEVIANLGGFILMATDYGSLIVAFDDQYVSAVRAHPLVDFVGGVTLDPQGPAADKLQRLFAQNIALQMAGRSQEASAASPYPPGYKPLRWSRAGQEGGS